MHVRNILDQKQKTIYKIDPGSSILEAVETLNSKQIGALIVEDGKGKLKGIITERDVLSALGKESMEQSVESIMTPAKKLIIAHESDTVEYIMAIFTNNKIRHLPVIEEGKLTGIISIGDAVKALLSEKQAENRYLQDYISGAAMIP